MWYQCLRAMACPDENRLVEYIEGLLPDDGVRTVDHHIDQCATCRELLAGFAQGSGPAGEDREADRSPPHHERYQLHEVVGTGAMSVVYAATDRVLDRKVALKVLHDSGGNDALRMQREARAMSQLAHPNVLTVHDIALIDGRMVLTAELVRGQTVAQWLEEPQTWPHVLEVFVQAGRGLAAAHAAGIAHRDFKPSNVLIGDDGRVRVADFGLARRQIDLAAFADDTIVREPALSQTGAIVGTPIYMAPEQLAGAPADARSDQFSFCVALYEALYGERPFRGKDLAGLRAAIAAGPAVPRRSRAVPRPLHQLVVTGLAVDPARRHASMAVLCDRLVGYQRRRTRRIAGTAIGAAVVAISLAFVYARSPEQAACQAPAWTGTWGALHKQQVASAFAATRLPFAGDAARSVISGLDTFTARWSQTYVSICEATEVRHDRSSRMLDLGMACLDERRAQAHALTELLLAADPRVVEHAVEAVNQLGDLTACTDARVLAEHPDPPGDPETRAKLTAVTAALARVKALQTAGEYREAVDLGRSLLEPARATKYPPIEAEVLARVGAIYGLLGDTKSSEQYLLDGLTAAQAAGDVASTAFAAGQLAFVTATYDQHFAEAHRWLQLASGASSRLGNPATGEANLAAIRGAVALTEGDAREAQRQYQHAAELRKQISGADDPSVAIAMHGVAMGYSRAGDEITALGYYDKALAILTAAFGPSHPRVADVLAESATALKNLGRYDDAIAKIHAAIAIREQVFGVASPVVANALLDLAGILQASGRVAESLPIARRTRAIFEATSNEYDVSLALTSEGQADQWLGRLEEASGLLTKALAIQERVLGAEHPDLVAVLSGLGAVELAQRDFRHASASFERARINVEKAFGAASTHLIEPLLGAGEAQLELGELARAIAAAERALVLLRSTPDDLASTAQASFLLARALRAEHRDLPRAHQLAATALEDYRKLGDPGAKRRGAIEAWLARRP